jgi:biopolymer transport protein ExbD
MAIQLGEEDKPYNEINVTPMIDVMMVLLIIFILLTTAAVQGIKVDLPSASSARTLDQNKSRVIAVSNDGTISIDAVPVSLSELEGELRRSMASTPDLAVILRGDRTVQYDRVMQVLDICSKVGVPSLGMASTRPPASAPGGGA